MFQRSHIREGMIVRSIDGEKLGKVFAVQESEFMIEKGLFFPKDYICRYSEISDIRGDEIILLHGKEGLQQLSTHEDRGVLAGTGGGAGVGPGAVGVSATPAMEPTTGLNMGTAGLTANASATGVERPMVGQDAVTIPVHKEELDVVKRETQAGEVRVRKDVVEEEKEISVPVRRERVRVERRDVTDRPAAQASFQEETVVVPLRAEEVDVRKRAVVDEEVIIRKDAIEEEERVSGTVRREEVEVRRDGEVEGPRKLDLTPDDPLKRR